MTTPYTELQLSEHASQVAETLQAALRAMANFGSSDADMQRIARMLVVAEVASARAFRESELERYGKE